LGSEHRGRGCAGAAAPDSTQGRTFSLAYKEDQPRCDEMTASLFDMLGKRVLMPGAVQEYRFEDIGKAQQNLQDCKTAGAVILRCDGSRAGS